MFSSVSVSGVDERLEENDPLTAALLEVTIHEGDNSRLDVGTSENCRNV